MDTLHDRLAELADEAPSGGEPAAELWARGKRAHRLRTAALAAAVLVVGVVGTPLVYASPMAMAMAMAMAVTLPWSSPSSSSSPGRPARPGTGARRGRVRGVTTARAAGPRGHWRCPERQALPAGPVHA